ncbi:MAG: peptidyl-prolyl cis-trans isomerase [Nitrospirae bacterium]|nr:peptidyl-prolyl cis-trans isomerase [Nitrospirota bacterium]
MKKLVSILAIVLLWSAQLIWADAPNPRVRFETNRGVIVLELYPQEAPKTVENFLRYVRDGFYDGTIFHRVIKGFMIQGGGLTVDMQRKPTRKPIVNEADNGLKNQRGTVAMARTSQPNSATAQFFINLADNSFLNYKKKTLRGWGYCVFGKVVKGMDIVDEIANLPVHAKDGRRGVPISPVVIKRAVVEK